MTSLQKLRNNFLKNRAEENRVLYTQQRNKYVPVLRNTKKKYYRSLDKKKSQITSISRKL